MQIGELARRFAVAPSKIRFLEDEGLVRPVRRTRAGYREYDESSAEALAMILQAQSLGFTLEEIKGALAQTKEHGLRRDYLIGQIAKTDRARPSYRPGAGTACAFGLRRR
ncbi:MAG: MerR family transcriptional regulator [Bradyrhizobium sp.]